MANFEGVWNRILSKANWILLCGSVFLVSGCSTIPFEASELAYTKGQMVSSATSGVYKDRFETGMAGKLLNSKIEHASDIAAFLDGCKPPVSMNIDPGFIPFLSAISKLIYDMDAQKKARVLANLKKAGARSYSVELVVRTDALRESRCLAIMRHDEDGKRINAIVTFKLEIRDQLLFLVPEDTWARNTISATRVPPNGKHETIQIVAGVSLLGIGNQENGLPVLGPTGADAEKIGKVRLGSDDIPRNMPGVEIGPIPIPAASEVSVLRVAITEIGDIGFSIDERLATNKTISEAIGPSLSKAIEAYLNDE